MATITRFEDLEIWQLARQQCIDVEKAIIGLASKNIRLKDQIQGSSGSVMDNIAEGFEKESTKEFINYLFYAKGSCGETRSQLIRMGDLGYIDLETVNNLTQKSAQVSRKIKHFINYLKTIQHKGNRNAEEPAIEYQIEVSESEIIIDNNQTSN